MRAALAAFGILLARAADAATAALPPATHMTLPDGMLVIVVPTSRVPLVDARLVIRAGSADDPAGKEGLASLTASLLAEGAAARTAPQIAFDLEHVGGTLSAQTSQEQIAVRLEVLTKDLDLGLGLLHDVVVHPTFDPKEIERKREEAVGEIVSARDDPDQVADRALLPMVFGDSPYGHPTQGWEKSVAAISRDDVVAFHARHFRPDRAILVVVGDVPSDAAIEKVSAAFSDWKRPERDPASTPFVVTPQPKGIAARIVAMPEVSQAQIRLACPGVSRSDPDYFPILLGNTILGGGFTSRLVVDIRVTKGLTYRIGSRFDMGLRNGSFTISTFTKNETLRPCIDGILSVLRKLVTEGPTDEELAKAKRYLTGQFPLGLQAPADLAAELADLEVYGLPVDFLSTYPSRVDAVTLDDCRRALWAHFCTKDLDVLVVGDADLARKALAGLGPADLVPIP